MFKNTSYFILCFLIFSGLARADSFNLGPDFVVEEIDGTAMVTVTRQGTAPLLAETIEISTTNGTAGAGSDFTGLSGFALNFPTNPDPAATSDSATFAITLVDDTVPECEEDFSVSISNAGAGNSIVGGGLQIEIAENDVATLVWAPGTLDVPGAEQHSSPLFTEAGIACFKITAGNSALWRTRLTMVSGEASLELHKGFFTAGEPADYISSTPGDEGILLHQPIFSGGEGWYIRVNYSANSQWKLFTGDVHVQDLGVLDTEDAAGYSEVTRTFPPEGGLFYKAQPVAGAKAWALWLNGFQAGLPNGQIAVRKNKPGLPLVNNLYDFLEQDKMLLAPTYFGDLADTYFISVQGNEGDSVSLDSHLIEPRVFGVGGTLGGITSSSSGAPFEILEVTVPVTFNAFDVAVTDQAVGSVDIAVRKDFVPSQWQNDAYSEAPGASLDSLTVVPPVLSDGTWYITVYSDNPFDVTLTNGRPEDTGALENIDFLDDDAQLVFPIYQPGAGPVVSPLWERSGWVYYQADKIAEQTGLLGWQLDLINADPGTEIAVRQNAVPSRLYRRNAGSNPGIELNDDDIDTFITNAYDAVSDLGFLQRPSQQADVWYVGIHRRNAALGQFDLARSEIVPPTEQPDDYLDTVVSHPPNSWRFYRFDLLDGIRGWETRLSNVTQGYPQLVIRRALLPNEIPGLTPLSAGVMASGDAVAVRDDWFDRPVGEFYRGLVLASGDPLFTDVSSPVAYYVGVFNDSNDPANYHFHSEAIDDDNAIYADAKINPVVAFNGGGAAITGLGAGETEFFKVTIPSNATSWRLRVNPSSGDARMSVREGVIPDHQSLDYRDADDHGGIEMARFDDEVYHLFPSGDSEYLTPGDYFVSVTAELAASFTGTLVSEGEILAVDLGTPAPSVTQSYNLGADEFGLYQFDVPAGTLAVEVRLDETSGDADLTLREDHIIPRPSQVRSLTGYSYGFDGANSVIADQDFIYTIQNPSVGTHTLLIHAERVAAMVPLPASGNVVVTLISAAPLALEGGSQAVSGHGPRSWRFFEVNVPASGILTGDTTAILAWQTRITNPTGTGRPQLVVTKGSANALSHSLNTTGFPVSSPSEESVWPMGASWSERFDYARKESDPGPIYRGYSSLMAPWGRPLDGGTYYVGVYNDDDTHSVSYDIGSRTIGEAGSSSSLVVQDLNFSGGNALVTGLEARDLAVFRVTTPAAGAASWRARLDALGVDHEASFSLREGFIPDYQGGNEIFLSNIWDERSSPAGGTLVQKDGDECYNLFPEEGNASIPGPSEFYIVATSEGISPVNGSQVGFGAVDFTVTSDGEIPVSAVSLVGGIHTENVTMKSGEVTLYQFTVPPGSSSLEVALTNKVGNDVHLGLISGILYPEPFQLLTSYESWYGINDGTRAGSLYHPSLTTVADPTPGTYTLALRSNATSQSSWLPDSNFDLRIEVLGPQPLPFCGGTASNTNQPPQSWRYFEVIVPNNPNMLGWDIGLLENFTGGDPEVVIRKDDLPTYSPFPTIQSPFTTWAGNRQMLASTFDWTGDFTRFSDNYSLRNTRSHLSYGIPLVPGTYYVGVYNRSTTDNTSYTIRSRCVGTAGSGADSEVIPLSFNGGTDVESMAPRDAVYYSVTIPANTRSWRVELASPSGSESMMAISRGDLPSFFSSTDDDADGSGLGIRLQREGDEIYSLLPEANQEFLIPGDYYIAVVGRGTNGSYPSAGGGINNVGTGSVNATITSVGEISEQAFAPVTALNWLESIPVSLASSEVNLYNFEVPDPAANPWVVQPTVYEARLEQRTGDPNIAYRSDHLIPSPDFPSPTFKYGVDGGNTREKSDDQVITLINPVPGTHTLSVTAHATEFLKNDATANLILEEVGIADLDFDGGDDQMQLIDGQRRYYRVEVPEFIITQIDLVPVLAPVEAWEIELTETQGDVRMRVMSTLGDTGGFTQGYDDDLAIVVSPFLKAGEVYYVEVLANGLSDFTITSNAVSHKNIWPMPAAFNENFASTTNQILGEDEWHFYGVDVPKGNLGLLRTELVAISGNPDLYIREDGFPTLSHSDNPLGSNGSIVDRRLTGSDSEHANWVPLNGRTEVELKSGRWVIGVKANDTNAEYHLLLSTGDVTVLDYASLHVTGDPANVNEATNRNMLSDDFKYYRVDVPALPATPASLDVTFSETFGDVNLHIRDTIPPGNSTQRQYSTGSSTDYITDADDDNKNRWSYWASSNSGIDNPGTTNFNFPELRPGTSYYIGIRGRIDATFSLDVSPSVALVTDSYGPIAEVPYTGNPLGFDYMINPGESVAIKVAVPAGATRWVNSNTHSANVEFRLEQGTLPAFGSNTFQVHLLRTGANTSHARALTSWPFVPAQDYYALFTNTGGSVESVNFNPTIEGSDTEFDSWIGGFGLTGAAADPNAINNSEGIENLIAYALNINPTTGLAIGSAIEPYPTVIIDGHPLPFGGIEFHLPANAPDDICYIVEQYDITVPGWETLALRRASGSWLGTGYVIEGEVENGYRLQSIYSIEDIFTERFTMYRLKVEELHP